ncbi:unnamed protein product [Miscanthus lutarioriparius]|uniref:Uncharacterized protein n=1 Tax=Miscanthus lutarioriparius TaxID=422564 RepID=A0A811S8Z1_9POAL|nr:unnamed protein product [Miscanthus lutarioriparius]
MANRAEAAVVAAADREGLQNLFLDAARVLMLFGAVATVGIGTPSADPMQAFLGLLLWLLGVCLLALVVVPAAGRFPHAALPAVAILKYLFTLWN